MPSLHKGKFHLFTDNDQNSNYVRFMKYTRFEKARIIGARALQITMGAPVLIKVSKDVIDPVRIALMEFDKGVLPISVLRET